MSTWTFYSAKGTCARATHIALHEAGAAFNLVLVDFAHAQQRSPEYLAINAKGRVPALATPQGVLTETPGLLAFVAQSFPAAGLAPLDDAFAMARLHEFNSYLASTMHVAHAHGRRASRWSDDAAAQATMAAKVAANMSDCAQYLEGRLDGPWVLGERYSVCDPYLYTLSGWLAADGVDVARLPRLMAHRERMAERPAVQRMLAEGG